MADIDRETKRAISMSSFQWHPIEKVSDIQPNPPIYVRLVCKLMAINTYGFVLDESMEGIAPRTEMLKVSPPPS